MTLRWDCPPHHKRTRIMVADVDNGRYMARKNEETPFFTASLSNRLLTRTHVIGKEYPSLEEAQQACQDHHEEHQR